MQDVNDFQIGGEHYRSEYQHWDWVEDVGLGYHDGCASKYLVRWRDKNGLEDLTKSVHYLEKCVDLVLFNCLTKHKEINTLRFIELNKIPSEESRAITAIVAGDWHRAISIVKEIIQQNEGWKSQPKQ